VPPVKQEGAGGSGGSQVEHQSLRMVVDSKENNSHTSNQQQASASMQMAGVGGGNKPNLSPFVSLRGTSKSINGVNNNGGGGGASSAYSSTMKSPMPN